MAGVLLTLHCQAGNGPFMEMQMPATSTFADYVNILGQLFGIPVLSFTYEDEEGDRCAVEGDEDVHYMILWYQTVAAQQGDNPALVLHVDEPQQASPFLPPAGLMVDVSGAAGSAAAAGGEASPLMTALGHADHRPINREELSDFQFLGHGSAGTVYRVNHAPTRRQMAVKVIALEASQEDEERISRELDILRRCTSPLIIEYYGVFFAENQIHICTEYMDGGSLDSYGGRIPAEVLCVVVTKVLQGLHYLSAMKIMHRDVKPSNILINSAGMVKLCDFGVSRELEQSVTRTFVGTNAYMAPERILGNDYDERSEIWSLGMTLVELATGSFPFHFSGVVELMHRVIHEPAPTLPPSHHPLLSDFVNVCLQKQPAHRPTATALLNHHQLVAEYARREDILIDWIATVAR